VPDAAAEGAIVPDKRQPAAGRNSPRSAHRTQEYQRLSRDPVPNVVAEPRPNNILEWHFVIQGPAFAGTPYAGGQYHGKLLFPSDYPYKPPSIMMLTPNGRFNTNTRLCLSMSDFHPESCAAAPSPPAPQPQPQDAAAGSRGCSRLPSPPCRAPIQRALELRACCAVSRHGASLMSPVALP